MIGGDAHWKALVQDAVERVRNAVLCPVCGDWFDGRVLHSGGGNAHGSADMRSEQ
jgi:hypothetical protein